MKTRAICLSVALFTLVSQVVCFSAFVALDVQRWSNLGETGHEFTFSIPSKGQLNADAFVGLLDDISDSQSVSIFKSTSSLQDGKQSLVVSGKFAWDTFPVEQLEVTTGRLPKKQDEYLASYDADDARQCGTISSTGNIYPVLVQPIQKYLADDGDVPGQYVVTSTQPIDKSAIISEVSNATGLDESVLFSSGFASVHSANSLVTVSCALLFTVAVSYVLAVVAFPLTNAYSFGVLKLLGWGSASSWWEMMKLPVVLSIALSAAATAGQMLLVTGARHAYYLAVLGAALISTALILLISALALTVVSRIPPAGLASKRKTFRPIVVCCLALKVGILFAIAALIQVTAPMFNQGLNLLVSRAAWGPYSNLYVLTGTTLTESDLDLLSSDPSGLAAKYASLYEVIDTQFGGQFIQCSGSDDTARITVNANYLNAQNLLDERGERISISEAEADRVVLIPESMKDETENVLNVEQAYLSRLYEGERNRFGVERVPSRLNFIYYKDGTSFFVFPDDSSSEDAVTDPVIQVITSSNVTISEKSYLQNMGISFPMKMDMGATEAKRLQDYLDSSDTFKDNSIRVATIQNALDEELTAQSGSFAAMMLAALLFLCIGLTAGIVLSATIFAADRQEICVKKLLGWGAMSRYGITPHLVALCDALAVAAVALSTTGAVAPLVALISFGLDYLLYMLALAMFERKNLHLMLKGE